MTYQLYDRLKGEGGLGRANPVPFFAHGHLGLKEFGAKARMHTGTRSGKVFDGRNMFDRGLI